MSGWQRWNPGRRPVLLGLVVLAVLAGTAYLIVGPGSDDDPPETAAAVSGSLAKPTGTGDEKPAVDGSNKAGKPGDDADKPAEDEPTPAEIAGNDGPVGGDAPAGDAPVDELVEQQGGQVGSESGGPTSKPADENTGPSDAPQADTPPAVEPPDEPGSGGDGSDKPGGREDDDAGSGADKPGGRSD